MAVAIFPFPDIFCAICPGISALAMAVAIFPFSDVFIATSIGHRAFAVRCVSLPLSDIPSTISPCVTCMAIIKITIFFTRRKARIKARLKARLLCKRRTGESNKSNKE